LNIPGRGGSQKKIKDDLLDFANLITSRHLSCHFMARISTRIRLCFPDPGQESTAPLPHIFNRRIGIFLFYSVQFFACGFIDAGSGSSIFG
jgi:hypothetical protein